jgi:hypothetical protein
MTARGKQVWCVHFKDAQNTKSNLRAPKMKRKRVNRDDIGKRGKKDKEDKGGKKSKRGKKGLM